MLINIIFIILLLGLSFIFSGGEIGFASASETKLRLAAEEGDSISKMSYEIFRRYDDALISVLIGNDLVNIGSSAVATVIAIGLAGDSGAGIATAIMTLLIITFGEITPKILASRAPERFSKAVTVPIRITMWITYPLVVISRHFMNQVSRMWSGSEADDAVTEEDLETIIDTVEDEGIVDEDTADLLQSALDFDDVLAYEIITPRVDMTALDLDDSDEENLRTILKCSYSRIPVYQDTPDNIVGVLQLTQCLKALARGRKLDVKGWMMKPIFVHKTMPLPDVLDVMMENNSHMVIVTDEYGGTMGILTMEDVLEQIVGEIWDEKDIIDEEFVEEADGSYEVDGDMRIEDLFYELDIEDKDFDDDNATVGGWAIEMLEGYPKKGESFTYKNLEIEVTDVKNLRVRSLNVRVLPEEEAETEDNLIRGYRGQ
ncbi:MAG: HlyC/CorC family transporter [Firmicutes bacterium]|nr:HlyC/CorC family transporter [Bacillota bacterium]